MCTYKSFCWKIGTTSFRTSDFNLKIERQLELLSSFREANPYEEWERNSDFQERYYDFLKENGFLSGDAPRKDKDARQKTSGLCDIGLVTAERRLTPAGERLLYVSKEGDFGTDGNILQLPADSFLYFKQLLKTYTTVEGSTVRPYAVLALMLDELGYLTGEEFTYLLPLVTSAARMRQITEGIKRLRRGEITVDTVIVDTLMSMNNYREALDEFLSRPMSEELVCKVCINRKSARYDKPYYSLFLALQNLRRDDADSLVALFKACRKINIGSWWKSYLFDANTESAIRKAPLHALKDVPILDCEDEREFRKTFFRLVHLFKAKATLYDYRDLNRRYFNITDTVMFADGKAELTLLAKCFVSLCSDGLRDIAFTRSTMLDQDCALGNIIPGYAVTDDSLRRKLSTDYGIEAAGSGEVQGIIERERRNRFDRLVDTMFPDSVLLELLDDFEQRNDDDIRRKVCDNADVPTIFEYIVGIIWYKISDRRGDVLSAFNLSLDADLLPRTHAAGGRRGHNLPLRCVQRLSRPHIINRGYAGRQRKPATHGNGTRFAPPGRVYAAPPRRGGIRHVRNYVPAHKRAGRFPRQEAYVVLFFRRQQPHRRHEDNSRADRRAQGHAAKADEIPRHIRRVCRSPRVRRRTQGMVCRVY